MKKYILSVTLVASLLAYGQNKINLLGLEQLKSIQSEVRSRGVESPRIEAIVTMNDGWSMSVLKEYDVDITLNIDDNMFVASIPSDKIQDFADNSEVFYVEFGRTFRPMLDKARPASNVTQVQEGFDYNGATMSFNGKNVVAGVMDTGIDPNHVNFKGRVIGAHSFTNNSGAVSSATTSLMISRFKTDNTKETHGTHVAGIMAGSYNGEGSCAGFAAATMPIPYYGVATGSSIIMAGGSLSETNIIKGVQLIVDGAKNAGLPAVVNLSLGSNNGPHDGSGSLERAITKSGKDAVICISSGNEGDEKIFVGSKFTDTKTELKTFITDNTSGGVDIWSNSAEPLSVSVGIYSTATGKVTEVATVTDKNQSAVCGGDFTKYMSGSCTLSSEVNALNNRFHVLMSGNFQPKGTGNNVALIIRGKAGQQVYVYGYTNSDYYPNTQFTNNRLSGYTDGTTDGSINDMACAPGTIAVGAYTTRTSWPTFDGTYSYIAAANLPLNEVSSFSSFGTTYQGVDLPVICAPGANIISSLNRYYTENITSPNKSKELSASVDGTKATDPVNYWGPMQGTSMSCPYVSGTIALFLEADPELDVNDCIDILKTTAIKQNTGTGSLPGISGSLNSKAKQWGAGKLDALAGIKEVLRRKSNSGIGNVMADGTGYVIEPTGRGVYNVMVDGAASLSVRVYNVQGVAVAEALAHGNELTIDASGVANGVYILVIEAPNMSPISKKIALQ